MSNQPDPAQSSPALDTHALAVVYSNYFRSSASNDEVILDFGLHAFHRDANGPEPIRLTHRLVLSWNTAQALCRGLHHLLQQRHKAASDAVRPPASSTR